VAEEHQERGFVPPLADPAPLGLGAFALTTFALSIVNAGFLPEDSLRLYIPLALFYGGLAQLIAGLYEFRNNNLFGATAFVSYGAFWLSLGTIETLAREFGVGAPGVRLAALGWFFVAWAIFTVIMWIGSWGVHAALGVAFTVLLVTFILLALAFLLAPSGEPVNPGILHLAGYAGIVTSIVAWYIVAADVINTVYGRVILPVGPAAG
jgi:succinate-acetate transporter protein